MGYVGRDVESMIRDLTDSSVNMVRQEQTERKKEAAKEIVEERLLDILLPTLEPSEEKNENSDPLVGRESFLLFLDSSFSDTIN